MIGKTYAGVDASLDLTINGVAVNYDSIVNLTFEVTESLHDYACVEMSGIPTRAITDYQGAVVKFVANTGPKFRHEFYGSIEVVEPVAVSRDGFVNGFPFQGAKLHCYGNSYRMRGKKSRVWESITVQDMAEEMADTYGFSLDVPKVLLSSTRHVQQAESDWATLVRYCGIHGLRVNVHGTHMHIYDPMKALSRNRSLHRLAYKGINAHPGKIVEFKGHFGRDASDGTYYDVVVPVMGPVEYEVRSSEVLGTSGSQFDKRVVDAVDSYAEAKRIIHAEARDSYDWHADVEVDGLAGCYPGGIVDVADYRGEFDGFWYVKSVKHTINTNAFFSNLKLSRNVSEPLRSTATSAYRTPPVAVLRNGVWKSSKKKVTIYNA